MKNHVLPLVALVLSAWGSHALAQGAPPPAKPATAAPAAYEGASPAGGYVPKVPAGKSPPTVTWTGFQPMPDGSSRVFLQLTKEPEHDESQDGMNVIVRLRGAKVHFFNSKRPLDTRYFSTPVNNVSLKKKGKDVIVTLAMRTASMPMVSTTTDSAGYTYLVLEFPKGDYGVVAPPVPATPKKANAGVTTVAPAEDDEMPPAFQGTGGAKGSAKGSFGFGGGN